MPEKEFFIPDDELGEPLKEQGESSDKTVPEDESVKAQGAETDKESGANKQVYFESLESQARERWDARSKKLKEWVDELDSTFSGLGLKELLAKNPLIREELLDAKIPKDILPLIEKFFQKKNEIGDEMNKELDRINQEKMKHLEESVNQI